MSAAGQAALGRELLVVGGLALTAVAPTRVGVGGGLLLALDDDRLDRVDGGARRSDGVLARRSADAAARSADAYADAAARVAEAVAS
ncbi:hypothetical protein [Streptomyces nojiriensis]|uniref:hypothetical protein n=1 Tax=Streptomyces nojiriensis TaxID=66374 RepID=UPI003648966F